MMRCAPPRAAGARRRLDPLGLDQHRGEVVTGLRVHQRTGDLHPPADQPPVLRASVGDDLHGPYAGLCRRVVALGRRLDADRPVELQVPVGHRRVPLPDALLVGRSGMGPADQPAGQLHRLRLVSQAGRAIRGGPTRQDEPGHDEPACDPRSTHRCASPTLVRRPRERSSRRRLDGAPIRAEPRDTDRPDAATYRMDTTSSKTTVAHLQRPAPLAPDRRCRARPAVRSTTRRPRSRARATSDECSRRVAEVSEMSAATPGSCPR
jgi:hypothetical protein